MCSQPVVVTATDGAMQPEKDPLEAVAEEQAAAEGAARQARVSIVALLLTAGLSPSCTSHVAPSSVPVISPSPT